MLKYDLQKIEKIYNSNWTFLKSDWINLMHLMENDNIKIYETTSFISLFDEKRRN
jgi:hypothetical protein